MKQLTPLAFHYSDSQPGDIQTKHLPFVTVIMPIRNESGYIRESVRAVLDQDYPPECIEVLVVDGMSNDGTRGIVRTMQGQYPNLRLIDNHWGIVPTALNIGLKNARGDVIVRVDGHTKIAPDYVRQCVDALERRGADAVGGRMDPIGQGTFAQAVALATSTPIGVGGSRFHYSHREELVDTVYMGAWRREVFQRIGLFDEELVRNQDDEFNFRLIQAGGKICLDPSIRSVYHSRDSLGGLWRQYFQYGFYKVRVIQKRQAIPSWRHLVPGMFVLAVLGSLLLAFFTRQPLWALSVIGPYSGANVVASLWTARQHWRTLPILPIAFATMHVAYGIGFLWGLWRWRRWGFRFAG